MTSTADRLADALHDRYHIARELGQGGMATVYLARDVRHDRDVAIKVLHADIGAALGTERFLAEIRTTARLQHPHILPLLDSGDADGLLYYVMPLVTGETLRTRLERERQLPIADAVRLTREVADALGHAHEHGVIHRDIKPENVLLQDGHAVVADFGIALAVERAGGTRITQTGLSLGTPQYMSPEQAMGERAIDARTDIYALAAVCYEMLTGEPPFTGPTVQAIVAKVMTERPTPIHTVRDTVPIGLEAAVLSALAKLPADRPPTIRAFAEALTRGEIPHTTPAAAPRGARRARSQWLTIGGMVALATVAMLGWIRRPARHDVPLQFELTPPSQLDIDPARSGGRWLALSNDGTMMVFAAAGPKGTGLYLQRIGSLDAQLLPGAEHGTFPAFSPDGRWIAFLAADKMIRRVAVDGTSSTAVCPVQGGLRGLTWLTSSSLVYSPLNLGSAYELWRVPSEGGTPTRFAHDPLMVKEDPTASVDGRFVFYLLSHGNVLTRTTVGVVEMAGGTTHDLGVSAAAILGLVDGDLYLIRRDGAVVVSPFDARRLSLGTPIAVADSVRVGDGTHAEAAVSQTGTLLYTRGAVARQLVRVSPTGVATPFLDIVGDLVHPRLSPDGRHLAYEQLGPDGNDIWIADIDAHTVEPLTRDGNSDRPEWTPDGQRVIYPGHFGDRSDLVWQAADGSSKPEPLLDSVGVVREGVMSPDGQLIAYRTDSDSTGRDVYIRSTVAGSHSVPILVAPTNDLMPRFSPDSRWLAYVSDESGRAEVYIRHPLVPGRVAISSGGGEEPLWSRDRRHLIYRAGEYMVSATLALDAAPRVTRRDTLFKSPGAADAYHPNYDIFPDGSGFVFVKASETGLRQVLVLNWVTGLKKK